MTAGTNISISGGAVSVIPAPSFSGAVSVTNTTNSTSASTGSITTLGGVGITKDLYVKGNSYIQGDVSVGSTFSANSGLDIIGAANSSVF